MELLQCSLRFLDFYFPQIFSMCLFLCFIRNINLFYAKLEEKLSEDYEKLDTMSSDIVVLENSLKALTDLIRRNSKIFPPHTKLDFGYIKENFEHGDVFYLRPKKLGGLENGRYLTGKVTVLYNPHDEVHLVFENKKNMFYKDDVCMKENGQLFCLPECYNKFCSIIARVDSLRCERHAPSNKVCRDCQNCRNFHLQMIHYYFEDN